MINQNWWFTTILVAQYKYCPPLNESIKCDVLIVGGGFSGVSAAVEFLRKGLSVVLIERNIVGGSSSGRSAGFSLRLGAPPAGDVILVADCQSLASPDQPLVCLPEINGESVGRWIVSNDEPGIFCAPVPRHLLQDGKSVELTFVNSETAPISSLKAGAKDQRRIGIGVARFALIDTSGRPDLATYFGDSPRFKTMLRPGQSVDVWHNKSHLPLFGRGAICNGHWGVFNASQLLTIRPRVLGWVFARDIRRGHS